MTDQVDLSVVVLLLQGLHNVPNIGAAVVVAGRVVALVICQLIVFEVNLNDRVNCVCWNFPVKAYPPLFIHVCFDDSPGDASIPSGIRHLFFSVGTTPPAVDENGWRG